MHFGALRRESSDWLSHISRLLSCSSGEKTSEQGNVFPTYSDLLWMPRSGNNRPSFAAVSRIANGDKS